MHQNKTSDYLRLHIVVLIYGFTGILGKLITIPAIPLVWHRMWIAALVILFWLIIKRKLRAEIAGNGWKIFLAGLLIALHWITFFHAIKISNVSVALSCLATGAFFGSLLEPLIHRRPLDRREIIMGLIVATGIYIIFRFEGEYTAGIIIGLFSAFLSALFSVINSKLVRSHTPYRITLLEMLGGWFAIGIYLLISGDMNSEFFLMQPADWIYLLILGVICTAFAFIENVAIMRTLSAFTVLLAINLEPVYAIILALIFFNEGEMLSPFFFIGAGLIILTVFVDSWLKKRRLKIRSGEEII